MDGPIFEREASKSNCGSSTRANHWASSLFDAIPPFGIFGVVWLRESSGYGTGCALYVHHGMRKAHPSFDIYCNYSAFGKTLVCSGTFYNRQPPTSMGTEVLRAVLEGPSNGPTNHQSGRGIW